MKIHWKYTYTPEGQWGPDEYNCWAVDGYVYVDRQGLKDVYPEATLDTRQEGAKGIRVLVVSITQKGTRNADVPSLIHRFAAAIPTVNNCLGWGVSYRRYVYGNTVEEVQRQVEQEFNDFKTFFKHVK